jgi:hypothetical protein
MNTDITQIRNDNEQEDFNRLNDETGYFNGPYIEDNKPKIEKPQTSSATAVFDAEFTTAELLMTVDCCCILVGICV